MHHRYKLVTSENWVSGKSPTAIHLFARKETSVWGIALVWRAGPASPCTDWDQLGLPARCGCCWVCKHIAHTEHAIARGGCDYVTDQPELCFRCRSQLLPFACTGGSRGAPSPHCPGVLFWQGTLGLRAVCCRAAGLCTPLGAARSAASSPTIPRFDVPILLPALWDLCCSPAGMGQIPPIGSGGCLCFLRTLKVVSCV